MLFYNSIQSSLKSEFNNSFDHTNLTFEEAYDIAYGVLYTQTGPVENALEDAIRQYLIGLLRDYETSKPETKAGKILRKLSPIGRFLLNVVTLGMLKKKK